MRSTVNRLTRPAVADVVIVVGLLLGPFGLSLLDPAGAPYRGTDALGVALALAAVLSLLWRQVAPLPVLAFTSLVVGVNAAAGYPVSVVQWPVWIALFTCFVWCPWRPRAVALGVVALGVGGYIVFNRGPVEVTELSSISVCILLATVTGDATRSRRVSAAAVAARLASEERERAAIAEQAVQHERVRWARELHDAVGHAVNVMVIQAGVGRRVFAENAAFARDALGHVESLGREALNELDRLLRVVGDEGSAAPTTSDLGDLAERVRAAGRELRLSLAEVQLSPSASRALYRIVQEAVTNALRHTSAGQIQVDVDSVGNTVVVEVVNEGRGLRIGAPGRGLINMRERARLEGGDFEAGPVDGGFRVRATLPALVAAGAVTSP